MRSILLGVAARAAAAIVLAVPVGAQPHTTTKDRPVMVVLKEKFARDMLDAVVRREPGVTGRDIIAIRKSELSPDMLVYALEAIAQSRERHGSDPSSTVTIQLRRPAGRRPLSPLELAEARATIGDLQGRRPEAVRGVGAVEHVTLPASRVNRLRTESRSGR